MYLGIVVSRLANQQMLSRLGYIVVQHYVWCNQSYVLERIVQKAILLLAQLHINLLRSHLCYMLIYGAVRESFA